MRILYADDSVDSRALVGWILREAGYGDVVMAESASEAFAHLGVGDAPRDEKEIDLVLIDFHMPGMDGIEACRRIRAEPRLRDLPVIVVTADTDEQSLQLAFDAGAVDYIAKPLRPTELRARVRSTLMLKEEMDRRRQRERELVDLARQLETANHELSRLSFLDGLTGITNRRGFDEHLLREWTAAERVRAPVAVILIDIDHFKPYNDRYGHLAGDDCLKRVAATLAASLRRPADVVARYGGEEFVAVLPGTNHAGVNDIAEELRASVENLGIPHAGSPAGRVTVSLGAASIVPAPETSPQSLIDVADRALYRAKREGRNRVRGGSPSEEALSS